jgi:hypothetical protein
MVKSKRHVFNYRHNLAQESLACAFRIPNVKFKDFEEVICCKEETVNSTFEEFVALQNFTKPRRDAFFDVGAIFPVNRPPFLVSKDEDVGGCGLSEAQLLSNLLPDYFLTLAGVVPPQWVTLNTIHNYAVK